MDSKEIMLFILVQTEITLHRNFSVCMVLNTSYQYCYSVNYRDRNTLFLISQADISQVYAEFYGRS